MNDTQFVKLKSAEEVFRFVQQEKDEAEHDEDYRRATRGTKDMYKIIYAHTYGGDCPCNNCEQN